jgi:AhpD family alkylhydroperoxidase
MLMRLDYPKLLPDALRALLRLEEVVHESGLDPRLLELVKLRASQINGCARCLEMHTDEARALGEDQRRLDVVAAWRESSGFTPRERAALGWCEALTLVASSGAPDSVFAEVEVQFDPAEITALTFAITNINVWNRLNVGFRVPAGVDRPD